jgi:allophanate hydrolase
MNTQVEITAPGAMVTVQDLGRSGWRRFGVPPAGALDRGLLRIANRLAGNADSAPALEFFLAGPSLLALDGPVQLAFAGDFSVTRVHAGERSVLASWRSVTLQPGDALQVGPLRSGRIGYIALAGLVVAPVLGSASTYARARLGGIDGRGLAAGDRLTVALDQAEDGSGPAGSALTERGSGIGPTERVIGSAPTERVLSTPPVAADGPIRVVVGPQDDHFDAAAMAIFFSAAYRLSRDADRMGLRLEGPALQHRPDKGAEIVSDAVVPGSIQVPGNGQPIVLLADGQTAGGYPKIATVATADLARLASAPVGTVLRFIAVSVAEAESLALAHEAALLRHLAAIAPLTLVDGIDLAALYDSNLVSAMIDALHPPD